MDHPFDFERQDEDGKIEGEIEGDQIAEMAVEGMSLAFGTVLDVRDNSQVQVMYLEARTQNGDKHRLLFSAAGVADLVTETSKWIDTLIENIESGGVCTCGERHVHHVHNEAAELIDSVDLLTGAVTELKEGENDDRLW